MSNENKKDIEDMKTEEKYYELLLDLISRNKQKVKEIYYLVLGYLREFVK